MTDEKITELLEAAVAGVPDSPVPIGRVLRAARVRRQRRVAWVAGAAAVVVVAAGVTAVVHRGVGEPASTNGPAVGVNAGPASGGIPRPPAGDTWIGVGRTVYALPSTWPVVAGVYCGEPGFGHLITIDQPGVRVGCPAQPARWPAMEGPRITSDGHGGAVIDGHGSDGRMTLPSGWLAVPADGGSPVASAEVAALQAAGFRTRVVQATYTNVGPQPLTSPELGTPARIGSTVTVYERSPSPGQTMLRGQVVVAGGATSAAPIGHPGLVHIVGEGLDGYVTSDQKGRWQAIVPQGSYTVRATVAPPTAVAPGVARGTIGPRDACTTAAATVSPTIGGVGQQIQVVCPLE